MKRLHIPWSDRAIVIRMDECHPEPAEPRGGVGGGAAQHGEGPRGFDSWFTDDELAIVAQFRLPKRRTEWMLSRIAVKQLALDRRICSEPRACLIEQRKIGSWLVSLSHSGPYAAAAIEAAPVGIDVQVVRELKESAGHLFLSDEETRDMCDCAIAHRLLHFWCAKEAAWKQRGGATPTLKQIPIRLLSATDHGLLFDGAETYAVDDVIVALSSRA